MHTQKLILLFQMDSNKISRIQTLCQKLGFQTKVVSGNQFRYSLGYLAGINGIPMHGQDDTADTPSALLSPGVGEMLVFSGISSDELDLFLTAYREAGITPVACKGVLTPTNVFWSVNKLYKNLLAEHIKFSQ